MATLLSLLMLFLNKIDGRNGMGDLWSGLFVVALCFLFVVGACSAYNAIIANRQNR